MFVVEAGKVKKRHDQKEFDQVLDDFFRTYQDRGMKKWQGFMLSDYTSTVSKIDKKRAQVYEKKQPMSQEAISELLLSAYANHHPVSVQLKVIDSEDDFLPNLVGLVQGYQADHIVISDTWVELENINHVELC